VARAQRWSRGGQEGARKQGEEVWFAPGGALPFKGAREAVAGR
jgi:hypothetical protein